MNELNIKKRWLIFIIFLFLISIFLIWKVPHWQVSSWKDKESKTEKIALKDSAELEDKFLNTLILLFGGLATGLTAFLSAMKAFQKRFDLSKDVQITNRFTKAIEQLGSEQLEIRLGGIYALERISIDSLVDHFSIMEILSAYIRVNAPYRQEIE